jgi:hypothetical protein
LPALCAIGFLLRYAEECLECDHDGDKRNGTFKYAILFGCLTHIFLSKLLSSRFAPGWKFRIFRFDTPRYESPKNAAVAALSRQNAKNRPKNRIVWELTKHCLKNMVFH